DVNTTDKNAEKRFKEINEAYEVLSDADKRAKYDQLGANYQNWQRAGGQGGFNWGDFTQQTYRSGYNDAPDFSDFFSSFFGGGTRTRDNVKQPIKGSNIEQTVEVTLEEAYKGTERTVHTRTGKKKTVRIPVGVHDGAKIRIAGEGEPGYAGGPRG